MTVTSEYFESIPKVKERSRRLNVLPQNPEAISNESSSNEAGHVVGSVVGPGRFPSWLHRKMPQGNELWKTKDILQENRLPTVCEEAKCPNLTECWSKKTATFLVMGKECTRACGFCDIDFSKAPVALQGDEPARVAQSVKQLGLKHVVITMVARDDLSDGGAEHLANIVKEVRKEVPGVTIEVLTSDFAGNLEAYDQVLASKPDVFNHNIETVRELTPRVRHKATYERTLALLRYVKNYGKESGHKMFVKSGLMVGHGETEEQVKETIRDLKDAGCDAITIGQYLQANRLKLHVKSFVTPEQFKIYEEYGHSIGIPFMYCGPFVRSSYNAASLFPER